MHNRKHDETICILERSKGSELLYFLNVVSTRRVADVRRGAVVKALAVCSPWPHISALRAPLALALDLYHDQCLAPSSADGGEDPTDGMALLAEVFAALNAVDLSAMPHPEIAARALMWRGALLFDENRLIFKFFA